MAVFGVVGYTKGFIPAKLGFQRKPKPERTETMVQINIMRMDRVIGFAAEELKKYLWMMMPEDGEPQILYRPQENTGFRLGLLEDFDLANEAKDSRLDDVVHIDTDQTGGILAGSNARSVLFAVYRLLKENGCRWLYPGVDGEYIPMTQLRPVYYHKLADHRFRGMCNEGAENQQAMLETIDFYAKLELNVYMLEFDTPFIYYDRYYSHPFNEDNRTPEPVHPMQVKQWKRQCEAEISKRGLQFHDMGHGWTAEPFGLDSTGGWKPSDQVLTGQQRESIAMLGGVRELFGGVALNTNLCMSNPRVRTTMATGIADYAAKHRNVDYLHVWLADGSRNHCECEECRKARPSDYYLMIMNELDEILTARNLDTRIVFIVYVDTMFSPLGVRIQNPERFSLLYAPIHRSYSSSIREDSRIPEEPAYIRNGWELPASAEANLAFLRAWQKNWKGTSFSYEYHFWKHQFFDPGGLYISRRIYEDIRSLSLMGLDGYVEDGSQRSFFPNGFAMYVYAQTLLDRSSSFEEMARDYFSCAYGESWEQVLAYFRQVSDLFDFSFVSGELSKDPTRSDHYDPEKAEALLSAGILAEAGRTIAQHNSVLPHRVQTVSMKLLLRHSEYIQGIAEFLREKAMGHDAAALEALEDFRRSFGRHEVELERYFDHFIAFRAFRMLIDKPAIKAEEGT